MNARAITYRRLHDIPESWGTAVNVQAMVFGNMGETSATGVAFTRNPSTGESKLYGEFLINAQGEDVVAGIRTPQDITEDAREDSGSDKASMENAMPEAFHELTRIYTLLEKHYRDMQDMEFTVERGKLWMLQTRNGKRTARAALRIAVELANEKLISKEDAVLRVEPASLDQLLHPTIDPEMSGEFGTLMGWADDVRKLGVRVNADTPDDARTAIKFGAEGIGLCRTEHMFFEETRIRTVREMILAEDEQERRAALAKLLPMQRADFVELFEIMKGLPVTIRLLDPPLHEFLPHTQAEIEEVARAMNTDPRRLADRARDLAEFNPMLGFRGCRLAIAYPEIAEMQARAIFEAAVEAEKRTGKAVGLEVMVPLIATKMEFDLVKARIDATAQSVMKQTGTKLSYQVGTMIELPRACLMAGDIAKTAEFFSFGTNDLTQTTYGISRDDAAGFLGTYIAKGILEVDPFISVDRDGVGELVKIGVSRGRKTRPNIKVGICGEHGGDPASVAFCHEIGLDYVSCSPYRVPIARLAAAQAALGKVVASQA